MRGPVLNGQMTDFFNVRAEIVLCATLIDEGCSCVSIKVFAVLATDPNMCNIYDVVEVHCYII